jgi:rubredoxin-NAD+ reductase
MGSAVVILGGGMAGIAVARELRKLDRAVPLTIITADDGDFYAKPNLSNALAAGRSAAQLVATKRDALAVQLDADIRAGVAILGIDAKTRTVETSVGPIRYGRLVLALGASPIRLPIAGSGAADVMSVNNLADYASFRQRLDGRRRVAILGAGLIGCEFANDLAIAGRKVDVFDLAPQALGRLLPTATAAFFRQGLEAAGVGFHFGRSIGRVEKAGEGYVLFDAGGGEHRADLILSAVGLKPQISLAQGAGLTVNRGIVTDRRLLTSDPDVFALGDCAEVAGLNLPFVLPIMQQARALAKTLAGQPAEVAYPAMPVVVKTPACPTVVCPPPAGMTGEWTEEVTDSGARGLFTNGEGIGAGFALAGSATAEKQALAAKMPTWL